MNDKVIGAIFCLISAKLMSVRYLAAAIYISGASLWSEDFFKAGLEYVGSPLKTWSIISLVVGIVFIAYGLYQDHKAGKKK